MNRKNAVKCTQTIARLLEDLKKHPITASELEKGKQQIKTAYALSGENTLGCGGLHARYALYTGELLDTSKEIARVESVTLDDMVWIGEELLRREKASVSYVGREIKRDLREVLLEK